ncbi:MAG: hypothetical protein CMJ78_01435 [Planctomycetaceae bacterium]|nr:hypothetical protein [Planctomycetaceae bacterium]
MSNSGLPWKRQQLRVPRANRSLYALPDLAQVVKDVAANQAVYGNADVKIQGKSLGDLRTWSRQVVLSAAARYTQTVVGPVDQIASPARLPESVVVTGHQPSLFHPGVLVKNLATHHVADRSGGVGLNLIVDNDTVSSLEMRVPTGTLERPSFERVSLDGVRSTQPWEEARIESEQLFASFPDRVSETLGDWGFEPLLPEVWTDVSRLAESGHRLADCFSGARSLLERRWGAGNLELPISHMCQLDPFLWFTGHLLANLKRFREAHNEILAQYKQVNRIRSRTHPVPPLEQDGDWIEAPFWIWRTNEKRRGRLFAKQAERHVLLAVDGETIAELPLTPKMDACCAVEALRELPKKQFHLRTRALTTTLFARVALSDMFIHGIGGAKYDEMTDRIIDRFYGFTAPKFATLSATIHLPFRDVESNVTKELLEVEDQLRRLKYQPERFVDETNSLIARKRELIAEQHQSKSQTQTRQEYLEQRGQRRKRYQELRSINEQLATKLDSKRGETERRLDELKSQDAANAILNDREYSFCLYPEDLLREFFDAALRG